MNSRVPRSLFAFLLVLIIALPVVAYEYPLSSTSIREAYFAANAPNAAGDSLLAEYTHALPNLRVETFTTMATIETPYWQVAESCRTRFNFHAVDAVQEFLNKPMDFRIRLEIYFKPTHSTADNLHELKIKLVQNDKELVPESVEASTLYAPNDLTVHLESIGEGVNFRFQAEKIDASDLRVEINTSDRHVETTFDLARLR